MIHPSAIVDEKAVVAKDVKIGPFCCVGPNVRLDSGVELISHVAIDGYTTIGMGTKIFPFASIGHQPQDLKFAGEKSETIIGENNIIREYVTIQPGTSGDNMKTVVGNNCLFMVGSHVAHDCIVGNQVIMANNATLAGHVKIEDYVIIGGLAAIKQYVRIGAYAMIGGMAGVEHDVIPFGMVIGERGWLNGLNLVGLKRRGFSRDVIQKIQDVYESVFLDTSNTVSDRLAIVETKYKGDADIHMLIEFFKNRSSSLCQPRAT